MTSIEKASFLATAESEQGLTWRSMLGPREAQHPREGWADCPMIFVGSDGLGRLSV